MLTCHLGLSEVTDMFPFKLFSNISYIIRKIPNFVNSVALLIKVLVIHSHLEGDEMEERALSL